MMTAVETGPRVGGELRDLYREHRGDLVRLAAMLVREPGDAEEIVQDAFVRAHLSWGRLRDPDRALAYLRSAVLNGARSRLRHLRVVRRVVPAVGRLDAPGTAPSAEAGALTGEERRRVVAALAELPVRQRECLVLRYWLDLSEAGIAETLGISRGSVKTHCHRGLAALSTILERQ